MTSLESSAEARLAATLLIEVLDLPDDVGAVSQELSLLDRDQVVTVFAAEFESSVGPAAFLVYVYRLGEVNDDGRRGGERFNDDLATLETAARLETPGPRAISHSTTDEHGLILATSPAIFRALQDVPEPATDPDSGAAAPGDLIKTREEQSLRLLRLLTSADRAAAAWLTAVEASPAAGLLPEEAELSLFLNDEQSIKSLLRTLNRLLTASGPGRL